MRLGYSNQNEPSIVSPTFGTLVLNNEKRALKYEDYVQEI